MNSNQLKQFIAIAEEENITRASQKLFMSQSALSNTLKLLEDELNCSLFDRVSNRLSLNDNGMKLYSYAKKIIVLIETAERDFKTTKKEEIQIATTSHLYFSSFFSDITLFEKYHLKVIESNYSDIFDFLDRRNCDAIIAPDYPPVHKNLERFERIKLGQEQLLVSCPEGHPCHKKESVKVEELNGEQFFSFENDVNFRWQDYLFMSKGCYLEYCVELPRGYTKSNDISMLPYLCFYTSLVKEYRAPSNSKYRTIPISNPEAVRNIYLYYNSESRKLINMVVEKFLCPAKFS